MSTLRRFRPIRQAIMAAGFVVVVSACYRQTSAPPACISSIAGSEVQVSKTGFLGGFINIDKGRCSALFDVKQDGSIYRVTAWTAKHCSGTSAMTLANERVLLDFYAEEPSVSGSIATSSGYYSGIVATELMSHRRAVALNEVNKLTADPEVLTSARNVLDRTFDSISLSMGKGLRLDCGKMAYTRISDGVTVYPEKKSICASYKDVGIYDLEIPVSNVPDGLKPILQAAAGRAVTGRALPVGTSPALMAQASQWETQLRTVWKSRRLSAMAFFVDWYRSCSNNASESQSSNGVLWPYDGLYDNLYGAYYSDDRPWMNGCPQKEALRKIVGAATNGIESFDLESELAQAVAGTGWQQKYKAAVSEGEAVLATKWLQLTKELLSVPLNPALIMVSNVAKVNNGQSEFRFAAFPVSEFAQKPENLSAIAVEYGYDFEIPRDEVKIDYQLGDSGSFVLLYGAVPLLSVNSVDGVESSGGASVLPVPQKKEAITTGSSTAGNSSNVGVAGPNSANSAVSSSNCP